MVVNYFERRAATLRGRLEKIKNAPADPTKLKSNLMLYQCELEREEWLNEAWKAGKQFIFAQIRPLGTALGFYNVGVRGMADRAGEEMANKAYAMIRKEGYPEMACDRSVIPAVLSKMGDFPAPSFVVANNMPCDHGGNCYKALALQYKVPLFTISVDFKSDSNEGLKMITDDLGAMIEFAEHHFPGIKYSEDKFVELMEMEEEETKCFRDIYQLLKRVPCTIDPREGFREFVRASDCPYPQHVVDWVRMRRDELYERAEKGIAALKEEKLRAIWPVTGFNNDRAPLEYLESRGVAVLLRPDDGNIKNCGLVKLWGDETQFGRKLTPLEELGRDMMNAAWGGLKEQWTGRIIQLLQDLKCDFLINFQQYGCVQTIGLAQAIEEEVKKKLGLPSLRMEGRSLITEGYNREEVLRQFGDFVDMMLDRKGIPRR